MWARVEKSTSDFFFAFFHSVCERDGRDNELSGPRLVS